MAKFTLKDYRPYRLLLTKTGKHRFGGPASHNGAIPIGTEVPLHHFLTIDLSDPNCPVKTDRPIDYLPLYYPLKYGQGGARVQYGVVSNNEIQILHMSDPAPDEETKSSIQVAHLPESRAHITPLEYEEARILGFMALNGYFQPNAEDWEVLRQLDCNNLISIGGLHRIPNAGDVICRNEQCEFSGRRVYFEVIARIPAIPINGSDEFWYDYQGGDVEFCFGLCRYCGTVIGFNVAS